MIQVSIVNLDQDPSDALMMTVPAVPRIHEQLISTKGILRVVDVAYDASVVVSSRQPLPVIVYVRKSPA